MSVESPLAAVGDWTLPRYGHSTLADLLPSIGAHLQMPGDDVLLLPGADRYVVLLVDGLGWQLLRRAIREVPYLADLLGDGRPITSGVPSTTVTSLTSLGTGLTPGQHGMAGYTCRVPATGEILNALVWDSAVAPRDFQSQPTYFERLRDAGVSVSSVAPQRFRGSGLTWAALRGPAFYGIDDERDEQRRIDLICSAALSAERSVVYAYERELDHTGHTLGCESEAWLRHLRRIDAFCERLREQLDDDVRLIITGDHGMLDIPKDDQLIVEDEPELLADVIGLAGEGRLRQLYTDTPGAVQRRWADRLGGDAWVLTRDEAVQAGWFGPMDPALAPRFGDVLVAMRAPKAVMSRRWPRELDLVGMHGSLTEAEMTVPLLTD